MILNSIYEVVDLRNIPAEQKLPYMGRLLSYHGNIILHFARSHGSFNMPLSEDMDNLEEDQQTETVTLFTPVGKIILVYLRKTNYDPIGSMLGDTREWKSDEHLQTELQEDHEGH